MKEIQDKIFVVIPVYNEEKIIQEVIDDIQHKGLYKIIIVDDGSPDGTYSRAKEKESDRVIVLRHKINRGKGAAVKTGIEAANLLGAEVVVTMDGDGQHNPEEIKDLSNPILCREVDVVLGTRLKNSTGMPTTRYLANHLGNFITWLFYGLYVTDSQSGFRAYSARAAKIINTQSDRYEYDSEVIREIKTHGLKFREVPISVLYTEYSKAKTQKQNFINGIKTLYRMIFKIIS